MNQVNQNERSHFFPEGLPERKKRGRPKHPPRPNPSIDFEHHWFWGDNRLLEGLKADTMLSSQTKLNSLIIGETGCGKEIVAKLIHQQHCLHQDLDPNKTPFVAVNCASIPESLAESILFGHERGAFTSARDQKIGKFELAGKGSIFLDEIQNLDKSIQAKLLRVLQERKVEPLASKAPRPIEGRFVAATNIPLEILVDKGLFRRDLFYRLNVCPLYIPALRHRLEDLPGLLIGLQAKIHRDYGIVPKTISNDSLSLFREHKWPGNLRELEHALLYASLKAGSSETLRPQDLPNSITGALTHYLKKGLWDVNGCFKALS